MWEEYELTYNRAMELRNEKFNGCCEDEKAYSGIKKEKYALWEMLMSMPLRTIKNVSERYEFLKTQHDDLVEAEATLEKNYRRIGRSDAKAVHRAVRNTFVRIRPRI